MNRPNAASAFRAVPGRFIACVAAILALLPAADAVTLNPRGLGQMLIYPYYTVNAGFSTLLSVVNMTQRGKALKLRFHEGRNGRTVFSLNLYLSPLDVWVAQVYSSGDENSVASIATNDFSCVVPALLLPVDPGSGPPRANFSSEAFSGANADGGPTGIERTREGYFDLIEMGEVTDLTQHTLTAISHDQYGVPVSCEQLRAAWSAPGGYWGQNPLTDLAPPTGGLYGAESIINVGEGLMYTINATAIDGFSNAIQHTGPGDAAPDLNTGSKNVGGTYSAFVAYGARLVEADYTKSEDAISALFTVDNLYNEYVVESGVGAQSDWIITFPTKRFYTDPALLAVDSTQASAPFDVLFSSANGGTSCVFVREQFWDREELGTRSCPVLCPPVPAPALCYATSPLTIGSVNSSLGSRLVLKDASEVDLSETGFTSGWMRVDLVEDSTGTPDPNHVMTSMNGVKFLGMPALGFLALDYVNGNAVPGVLANYSGAYPHRGHVTCVTGSNENPCQ